MRITLLPLGPEDARTIGRVESAAATANPAGPLMWPGMHANASDSIANQIEFDDKAEQEVREALEDPKNTYVKAVDEDAIENGKAEVVAYSWWKIVPGRTPDQWDEYYANRWRPPTCNAALMDALGGARTLKRAKILGDKEYFTLQELYVLPEYQRKGIGTKLLLAGLERADREGLFTYIEATRFGLGLYLKHGFVEKDRVEVDLGDYGGEKGMWDRWALMVREPRQTKA